MAKQLHQLRWKPLLLTTSNVVEDLGSGNSAQALIEGAYFTDWDAGTGFAEKFRVRYGVPPLYEAESHYLTLMALAKAHFSHPQNIQSGMKAFTQNLPNGRIDFASSNFGNFTEAALYRVDHQTVSKLDQ